MSRVPVCSLCLLAASAASTLPAYGQAVISTRSGLVHFFEGSVSVAGQPLESRLGKFTSIPEGGELRTGQGRAEVLLTPGVFLRIGERSAIRMVANALADTRVELLAGSAMVESADPAAGTSVTMVFQGWNVRQAQKGSYRLDADPPRVDVREGRVEVAAAGGDPVAVEEGMDLPLAAVLVPEKSSAVAPDALTDWAEGRDQSISADNAIAANIQDPASMSGMSLPGDDFTYFPMLGVPTLGTTLSGLYGSSSSYPTGMYGSMYQTGFSSIYLPGITYRPFLLGLPSSGLSRLPGLGLGHTGYSPYTPRTSYPSYPYRTTVPGSGLGHLPATRPVAPTPVPHGGVHVIHH